RSRDHRGARHVLPGHGRRARSSAVLVQGRRPRLRARRRRAQARERQQRRQRHARGSGERTEETRARTPASRRRAQEPDGEQGREAAALEHERTMESLKRELGRLVVETTAKVTDKVLTPEDQRRLQEETARQLA